MSSVLEGLNNPSLVASAGAATVALLPALQQAFVTAPWPVIQRTNAAVYALNVIATSRPGRLDGQSQRQQTKVERAHSATQSSGFTKKVDTTKDAAAIIRKDTSLVNPAGWAFSIWLPIFAGELLSVIALQFLDSAAPAVPTLRAALPGFLVAQVCQILWSAAFRPKYMLASADSSSSLSAPSNKITRFIPAALLTATGYALNRAHQAYTLLPNGRAAAAVTLRDYLLFLWPLSMHFGWISAAFLVAWNNAVSYTEGRVKTPAWLLPAVGHVSAVLATALGMILTVQRRAPLYGAVIAWALKACGDTLKRQQKEELEQASSLDSTMPKPYTGIRVQRWLCRIGTWCSAAASAVVLYVQTKKFL